MKKWSIVAVAVLIVAAIVAYEALGHSTPKGQARLSDLTQSNLDSFERDFNQSAGSVRVLALLSPT